MQKFIHKILCCHFTLVMVSFIVVCVSFLLNFDALQSWQVMAYMLYLGLCFHQVEEYFWPGGFIWGFNTIQGSDTPNCYPGNRMSATIVDVVALVGGAYLVIVHNTPFVAAFFAIFCIAEFVSHTGMGILIKHKLKDKGKETIYFPGLASSFLVFAPVGVVLIYDLLNSGVMAGQWFKCIGCVVLFALVFVLGCQAIFAKRDTPYPYHIGHYEGYFRKYL